MGKAKKLKLERKAEKQALAERKSKRKKRVIQLILGFFIAVIIFSTSYMGLNYAKNKWFGGKDVAEKTEEAKADKAEDKNDKYKEAPALAIDQNKSYVAKVETNKGNFEIELDAKNVPVTVNNFVFLAKEKFYDGLSFHRIIRDFMIQSGDPKGDGTGGPGYKFDDEKIVGDYTQGIVAMANSGEDTNGSQFFIMTGDYSGGKLPKNYVIFGKVVSGMDVVLDIAKTPVSDNGQGEESKPKEMITISKITIEEK